MFRICSLLCVTMIILACGPGRTVERRTDENDPDLQQQAEHEYSIAYEYLKQTNYPEAREHLANAIKLNPAFYAAFIALGQACRMDGDSLAAESAYLQAQTIKPQDTRAYEGLAALYAGLKRHGAAIAEYERALGFDSVNANLWSGLAQVYVLTKDYKKAVAAYQKSLTCDPENLAVAFALATVFIDNGEPEKAQAYLEDLKTRKPEITEIRKQLAEVYLRLKQEAKAVSEYTYLISREPDNFAYHWKLGTIYLQQKSYLAAQKAFENANRLAPDNPLPLFYLGDALIRQDKMTAAENKVKEGLALAPDNVFAQVLLGDIYERRGYLALQSWDKNKARENIAQARSAFAHLSQAAGYYDRVKTDAQYGSYAQAEIKRCSQWSAQLKEDIWYYGGSNP
jgi:tetratricopeptide (TPR) repeat protein